MRKFLLLLFVAASALQAALPPLAQSTREIKAILSAPELHTLLGSAESIQSIRRTPTGYVLSTQHYLLQVDIYYNQEQVRPGPVPFQLTFHMPTPFPQA
ncbi:MAG: hypothetical protein KGJ02_02405 [Verrucomicrobiota bacterium]|nr:hypothetical protein [Verrucomicrobiota bacterium]